MMKSFLPYLAVGTVVAGGAGIGGYVYWGRDTSKEQKQRSISAVLTEAGKKVLSTAAGSTNVDEEEWKKRQTAYGTATDEELITDLEAAGQETKIQKVSTGIIEKMKKWCQKYSGVDFTVTTDVTYKKVLKWCT